MTTPVCKHWLGGLLATAGEDCVWCERDELRAKLEALEKQDHIAWMLYDPVFGTVSLSFSMVKNFDGEFVENQTRLYLAAGAKEANGVAVIADAWADVEKHFAKEM